MYTKNEYKNNINIHDNCKLNDFEINNAIDIANTVDKEAKRQSSVL